MMGRHNNTLERSVELFEKTTIFDIRYLNRIGNVSFMPCTVMYCHRSDSESSIRDIGFLEILEFEIFLRIYTQ